MDEANVTNHTQHTGKELGDAPDICPKDVHHTMPIFILILLSVRLLSAKRENLASDMS